jgi:type I restriction enzyme M protein
MNPITQAEINKAAWAACDTFRGVVDPSVYKDYVLTLLFLKYLSNVWKDHRARNEAEHPDHPDLVDVMMLQEAIDLAKGEETTTREALETLRTEKKSLMQQLLTDKRRVVL